MSKTEFTFTLPKPRFDDDLADVGVEIPVRDENDSLWGVFKVKLQDDANPRHRAAKDRYANRYQKERAALGEFEKLAHQMVYQPILVGWSGVIGGDGKEVPFSREAAFAYLTVPEVYFVMERLWPESHNVKRFQKDEETGN